MYLTKKIENSIRYKIWFYDHVVDELLDIYQMNGEFTEREYERYIYAERKLGRYDRLLDIINAITPKTKETAPQSKPITDKDIEDLPF